ncbi:anoctamin-4-like isoform X2 [Gigantopelta aegis]|uniref:anoctamin-4-like isoform X2 n=1 Tax=Gigantopelta aegis TaxID=1735272 RepID=UPI001B889C2F|nr:anoctamin-4-like isoform X2 [Gigantopelta aegis]
MDNSQPQSGGHISRISVGGQAPAAKPVNPIGFELQNMEAGNNGVSPVPAETPGLYPKVGEFSEPGNMENQQRPAPIGFEGTEHGVINEGFQGDTSESRGQPSAVKVNDGLNDSSVALIGMRPRNPEEGEAGPLPQKSEKKPVEVTHFFKDGKRRIDFILAYDKEQSDPKKVQRREVFEDNLRAEGLDLEKEEKEFSKDSTVVFIKIHITWDVLIRYAEIMNMKMPLHENDLVDSVTTCWSKCPTPFDYDSDILPDMPDYFTAAFSCDRVDQFIIQDKDTFFTPAQRSLIVYQILSRCIFEDLGDKKKNKFGIKKLLSSNTYQSAYPIHEGYYKSEHSLLTRGKENDRHLLYMTWARPAAWYKFQPLDHIRKYFGEKIAIYFTWLGYYTGLLIPAAIFGLVAFFYGLGSLWGDPSSLDICNASGQGNTTMCPLCDKRCSYWQLKRSCLYSRITYLFDNEATVAFAAFMALWATFFHEMWKRKQAEIQYDWDVSDFEEEEVVRPEYEASVTRTKVNPVNQVPEPSLSFFSRFLRLTSSLWVVLFMLCVVVAAVFGVIVYRITVSALLFGIGQEDISQRASIITSATAAMINLVIIIILGRIYLVIAKMLTNFETHRTQTEWEDSFTLKMFLFQFVNHYASLFYIAFFKGKLIGRPGNYNRDILDTRQEECDPAGCLIELCIQLGIIMVGKQTFNNFKELIWPKVMNWFKSRNIKSEEKKQLPQWEEDYIMTEMPDLGLFDEYLEMVLQFGFVTVFVAAFPLAPLFALLNNIIEVRLDAYKFVTTWKRPLAARAQDIGVWFGILKGVSTIAIFSNACIIAFTSEFIPKLVYKYGYSNNNSLDGYMAWSLSKFYVKDFEPESVPSDNKTDVFGVVTQCFYRDYRDPSSDYHYSVAYWHIMSAKLAFIIVFVIAVGFLSWLIAFLVPDIPREVKLQILREKHLAKEALFSAKSTAKLRQDRDPSNSYSTTAGAVSEQPLY